MADGAPAKLAVYSRPGCHLCDELIESLLPLIRGRAEIDVRNVDSREAWRDRFGLRIPVVELDDEVLCEYRLDAAAVRDALDARDLRRAARRGL